MWETGCGKWGVGALPAPMGDTRETSGCPSPPIGSHPHHGVPSSPIQVPSLLMGSHPHRGVPPQQNPTSAFTQHPSHHHQCLGVPPPPPFPVCPSGTSYWIRPLLGLCHPWGQQGWNQDPQHGCSPGLPMGASPDPPMGAPLGVPMGAQPPTSPSALPGGVPKMGVPRVSGLPRMGSPHGGGSPGWGMLRIEGPQDRVLPSWGVPRVGVSPWWQDHQDRGSPGWGVIHQCDPPRALPVPMGCTPGSMGG